MRYSVRYMREDDIPQVTEIDREAFPSQWPYPAYAYKRELNNKLASYIVAVEDGATWGNGQGNHNGSILQPLFRLFRQPRPPAEIEAPLQCIAGFAGVWRMLDEAHLTTIAVRGSRRRRGIGELLLVTVIDMAIQGGASVVTLEVRVSNQLAQTLYRKYGFKDAGIRKGYYSEDGEDALIMTTEVLTSEAYQSLFRPLKEQHARHMAEQESAAPVATAAT
ncbi:MAG: ribosomal protein S18-alanine N-acetyltransferase [Chloroflexi bacterium]|nr:ribosomal protein S18-alanine N-acetyltransferase [Chloroflexota bacterium]